MSTVSLWRGADLPMSSCKRALLLLWLFLGGGALLLLLFRAVIAGAYGQASEDVWAWFLPNIIPTLSLMIGVVVMDDLQRRKANAAETKLASGFLFRLGFGLSLVYLFLILSVIVSDALMNEIDDPTILDLTKQFSYLMGPFQGIIAASLGAFFTKG